MRPVPFYMMQIERLRLQKQYMGNFWNHKILLSYGLEKVLVVTTFTLQFFDIVFPKDLYTSLCICQKEMNDQSIAKQLVFFSENVWQYH